MKMSDSIKNLLPAFAAAQAALKPAVKDALNPFHKSKYADLESVWDACRDALRANNLVVLQPTSGDGVTLTVHTIVAHVPSSETVSSDVTLSVVGMTAQQLGSFITYARRYGLTSLLGIVAVEDDDANAVTQPVTRAPPPARPAAQPDPTDSLRVRILAAPTAAALQLLVPELSALPDAAKAALRPVYNARADALAAVSPPPASAPAAQPAAPAKPTAAEVEKRLEQATTLSMRDWLNVVTDLMSLPKEEGEKLGPKFRAASQARDQAQAGKAA